jgi:aminoglycoside phosphotransferase (APT) family kinase protein
MRLAEAWLRRHMPVMDQGRHGSCGLPPRQLPVHRTRRAHIAWLDWELGRIGDRHQDIAWTTTRAFGHLAEDGKTFLTCGLLPEAEFLDAYEKRNRLQARYKAVHWYKVYNDYMIATLLLATGYRIANGGKTHQDVLVTWLMGIGITLLEEMRALIEEAP